MIPNEIGVMLNVGQDPVQNIAKVKSLGMRLVQMGSPGDDWLVEPKRSSLKKMIVDAGLEIFTVFVGFENESYADFPTVRETVGFLNPKAREARLQRTFRTCDLAKLLGAGYVGTHIGFIPEDLSDPQHGELVAAVRRICDYGARLGLGVAMETGQEPGDLLVRFIREVGRKNLFVNFDPANMILYGSDDPHAALAKVKDWVVSVHCKDGVRPTEKDQLGEERALSQGEVDIPRFIRGLKSFGYTGPLFIEREITGPEQVKDIRSAVAMLEKLLKGSE